MTDAGDRRGLARWRLALGRYAGRNLDDGVLSPDEARMDAALDYLYGREYTRRGLRQAAPRQGRGAGSLDPTQLTAIRWLGATRELFPASVCETLQAHALERYELTDLLRDPRALESLTPDRGLLKALMGFQGRADPALKGKIREVARAVVDEITRRLRPEVERAFSGRRNRFRRSQLRSAANFDWRATLRANLKTWDAARKAIVAERLHFVSRERRRLPWTVILAVDQSGSMLDSLIHSAVMAAILTELPGVEVKMVLFDTSVVDVTEMLADPVETLLSVQLGGGTDIGKAVGYCEGLVTQPSRTILVLVSDFCEGASPRALYAAVARLAEARVRLIGLAALSDAGHPAHDGAVAARLAELGMAIGAMTPDRLAQWLAETIG